MSLGSVHRCPSINQDSRLTHGCHRYTKEEFEDLCFDFGIELDEDTEDDERPAGVPAELKIGQSGRVDGCAETDGS